MKPIIILNSRRIMAHDNIIKRVRKKVSQQCNVNLRDNPPTNYMRKRRALREARNDVTEGVRENINDEVAPLDNFKFSHA